MNCCYQFSTELLAQDEGGPSKGGSLNHLTFSCTDLYVCNVINGMYIYKSYIIQENQLLFRKPPLLGPPLSLPETNNHPYGQFS